MVFRTRKCERERENNELAQNDENRRAMILLGMLNPMRDRNEGTCQGGGTTPFTTAYGHGMHIQKVVEVRTSHGLSWEEKLMTKKQNKMACHAQHLIRSTLPTTSLDSPVL